MEPIKNEMTRVLQGFEKTGSTSEEALLIIIPSCVVMIGQRIEKLIEVEEKTHKHIEQILVELQSKRNESR